MDTTYTDTSNNNNAGDGRNRRTEYGREISNVEFRTAKLGKEEVF